jgi:hypothetical protein
VCLPSLRPPHITMNCGSPPVLVYSRSVSATNNDSTRASRSSSSSPLPHDAPLPAPVKRARLAGFAGFSATLRCVETGRTTEFPLIKLPLVSKQVVYDLETGAVELAQPLSGVESDAATASLSAGRTASTSAVFKKLKMLSGKDMTQREMGVSPELEKDRRTHYEKYAAFHTFMGEGAVWEEPFASLEQEFPIKAVRCGLVVNEETAACLAIRNATLGARPARGAPPEWCTPNVLGSFRKSAVEALYERGWVEYANEKVRLGGPCVPIRNVRRRGGEGEAFAVDVETGAQIVAGCDPSQNAHDWVLPQEFVGSRWVCFPPLMQWRMRDVDTGEEVKFSSSFSLLSKKEFNVQVVQSLSPQKGSVLHTSSRTSKFVQYSGGPPIYQERACPKRLLLSGGGANTIPWNGAHAWDLRGTAMVDTVVYTWTSDSCDVDLWRACLASKNRRVVVLVGSETQQTRVWSCFRDD